MNRPQLKSHAQPLRRGPGSIQLGLCPERGVVLDGLSAAEISMAESLDGSTDIETLYAAAAASGIAADRVSALLAMLSERRLLVDTDTDTGTDTDTDTFTVTKRAWLSPSGERGGHLLRPPGTAAAIAAAYRLGGDGRDYARARSTQYVVISGEGELPSALAALLRIGGIGEVSVGENAVDLVDLELRGHRPGAGQAVFGSRLGRPAGPDLVVLAAMGAIHADAGEPWLRRGIPHLPLVVQSHRVQVGPLITGLSGPCLGCMDLHRRDKDAAWPALLSQLAPTWPLRPGAAVNVESTLNAMTIGLAAMIVHSCLDGQPVPGDLSLELSLPWPAILSRRWFRHPLCDCAGGQATIAG